MFLRPRRCSGRRLEIVEAITGACGPTKLSIGNYLDTVVGFTLEMDTMSRWHHLLDP